MKFALLASVAAAAFMSDVCETVVVTVKGSSDPVRVNKSDFDKDQADDGEKRYSIHKKETASQPDPIVGEGTVPVHPDLTIPPAPSAPAFVNPVAPSTANHDTLFVIKSGTGKNAKYFVVDTDGNKVTDKRDVDVDGYATEALAWAAVEAVKKQPFEQSAPTPPNVPEAPVLTVPPLEPPAA